MKEKNPLGYVAPSRLLMQFAIPSIISMLVSSLYNIVDQVFIGQGVGYLGNAATNVAYPLTTISLAISLLIGIGSASRFSLFLGQKKETTAQKIVGNALLLALFLGILYMFIIWIAIQPLLLAFGATKQVYPFALAYTSITAFGFPFLIYTNASTALIRADGKPTYSMLCMVIGALINVILDPLFIFVFKMGVEGAAYATVAGQIVSALLCIFYRFEHVQIQWKHIRFSWEATLASFSIGVSSSVNQLAILLVQIVMNNSMVHYGADSIYGSEIPLAAAGIVMKVNAILFAFIIGLSQGMQPIIGFNYGAKQYKRVKETFNVSLIVTLILSLIGWSLFQFIPETILSLFGKENELYMEFAVLFMRIFLFLACVNGIQIIASGFFSAIGKPMKGLLLSLSRQVILFIPIALLLPYSYGLMGVLYAAPCADAIAFLLAVGLLIHEYKILKQKEKNEKELQHGQAK